MIDFMILSRVLVSVQVFSLYFSTCRPCSMAAKSMVNWSLASIIIIIIITTTILFTCCHHDQVIARVHSVHLANVAQRQAAADPQTKPHDLGCESAYFRQLASTVTIAIYYYYSARKLILIYRPTEGRRLS